MKRLLQNTYEIVYPSRFANDEGEKSRVVAEERLLKISLHAVKAAFVEECDEMHFDFGIDAVTKMGCALITMISKTRRTVMQSLRLGRSQARCNGGSCDEILSGRIKT